MFDFEVTSRMMSISEDTKDIVSDCMAIAFRNQGETTVEISVDSSGGAAVVLKSGEERNYSLIAPNMKYKGRYSVKFIGVGKNNLLVEKEYVQEIKKGCE